MDVERSVREEKNSLDFYVAKSKKKIIRGVAATEAIQEMPEKVDKDKFWQWLSKSDLII